jgi:hypothetical protein
VAVVTSKQLARFMSQPEWDEGQQATAELVCVSVESSLERALRSTFITPRRWSETARVLAGSGMVDTSYPVHRVLRVDGGPLLAQSDTEPGADADPGEGLPPGYRLADHRLFRDAAAGAGGASGGGGGVAVAPAPIVGGVVVPAAGLAGGVALSTPVSTAAWGGQALARPPVGQPYSGSVHLEYMAGWGAEPALVLAILRKAHTIMDNRHDDTVTVRGLDAQDPPKLSPETWSADELAALGTYRRLRV